MPRDTTYIRDCGMLTLEVGDAGRIIICGPGAAPQELQLEAQPCTEPAYNILSEGQETSRKDTGTDGTSGPAPTYLVDHRVRCYTRRHNRRGVVRPSDVNGVLGLAMFLLSAVACAKSRRIRSLGVAHTECNK
ncbi:hypothetical protein C8J57DRAFT_1254869 [Mycena rebaudengoi]|nr:hypothetical protein C8J57DRAFT_1254869 [Mycena rebaudengoi]